MARLIIEVPRRLYGGVNPAHEHLFNRQEVAREFGCIPFGSLEGYLGPYQVENRGWLEHLDNAWHLLEAPDKDLIRTAARILNFHNNEQGYSASPNRGYVSRVELDRVLTPSASALPVDLGSGFTLTGQHAHYRDSMLDVPTAWSYSKGAGKTIAVVDSGIEASSTVAIRKFRDLIDSSGSGKWQDDSGHGTAMATIIKDVAPDADVDVIRVYKTAYPKLWDVMAGLSSAVTDSQADIINLSLGFQALQDCRSCWATWQPRSQVLENLMEGLARLFTKVSGPPQPIFVCAVGNNSADDGVHHPAAYSLTLAVGAVTSKHDRSAFSNYDKHKQKGRYLMLPGGDDATDTSGNPLEYVGTATDNSSSKTNYCLGTSPATAYASALSALYWTSSAYQTKTPDELLDEILNHKCSKSVFKSHDPFEHGAGFFSWQ
jgi:subtilisin family serine protease